MPVVNVAAPEVWFVTPADGARLAAGVRTTVRVEAARADAVRVVVDGVPAWTAPGLALERPWTPAAGTHRLVAVASRDGAPDAIASIEVVAVEDAPVPAAPAPATPVPPATPAPPAAAPPDRTPPALEVTPAAPGRTPAAPPPPARPVTPSTPGTAVPPAAAPTPPEDDDVDVGAVAAIGRFLKDPERVAWTVAFPLLLILAALAYALLQRFVDGGRKLAWRGRGTPDDTMIEF